MQIFKIQDGLRPPSGKSGFGHNSATHFPISVKFCAEKNFKLKNSIAIEVKSYKLQISNIQDGGGPPSLKSLNLISQLKIIRF